jgi:hypothetical protein
MSGDLTDARNALEALTRPGSNRNGLPPWAQALAERSRPLIEPSDAERKLDEIQDKSVSHHWIEAHGDCFVCIVRAIIEPTPPRTPQVGDTVRVGDGTGASRTVLDVLDDGKVLRLNNSANQVGMLVVASGWEVVE